MKISKLLFESPDHITKDGKIIATFLDKDACSFGYYGNNRLLMSKPGDTHTEILDDTTRSDFQYPGRIWLKTKIISFYDYPETNFKLKQIVKDIERKLNIDIWNDPEFRIDINSDEPRFRSDDDILIPLKQFQKSEDATPEEKAAQHVLPPSLKKGGDPIDGFGSDKQQKLAFKNKFNSVAQMKAMSSTSEGLIRKLTEIGDRSSEPYGIHKVQSNDPMFQEYEFDTEKNKYVITFSGVSIHNAINYEISFGLRNVEGAEKYLVMTNEGKPFRIMATVILTMTDMIKTLEPKYRNGEIKTYSFYFEGTKTPDIGSNEENRRNKLYLAYIKNNKFVNKYFNVAHQGPHEIKLTRNDVKN